MRTLVVLDVDGVLTAHRSSWGYVHERFGVSNEENYLRFVRGEISYEEFVRKDIELWIRKEGKVRLEDIERILDDIPLRKGLESIRELSKMVDLALISGGIDILANRLAGMIGARIALANGLIADDRGYLTGEGIVRVDPSRKDLAIERVKEILGLDDPRIVAVGDSFFDVSMFRVADLSIAFDPADEIVEMEADIIVRGDLEDLAQTIRSYLTST